MWLGGSGSSNRNSQLSSSRRWPDDTEYALNIRICRSILLSLPRRLCFLFLFVCLFVCSQDHAKTTQPIFTKFGGKVAHGPRKRPLDFRCSTDLDPDSGIFKNLFLTTIPLPYSAWEGYNLCLTISTIHARDCRELPVSRCKKKLYTCERTCRRFALSGCFCCSYFLYNKSVRFTHYVISI